MANSWSLRVGNLNLTAGTAPVGDSGPARMQQPFRLLLIGDFRGAGRTGSPAPLAKRQPIRVDRDDFEEVLGKFAPAVRVPLGAPPHESVLLAFRDLEDFEPDRLFLQSQAFDSLHRLRKRLQNPAQFAEAAEEIKGWASAAQLAAEAKAPQPLDISPENLLDQMLGDKPSDSTAITLEDAGIKLPGVSGTDWDRFLRAIVAPHVIARADPRLQDFTNLVDEAISAQMRTILHHPNFQAIEAAWRSVYLLVRKLETDNQLQIWLLDATQDELAQDVLNVEDLSTTGIYQQLVHRTASPAGEQPWAMIASLFRFGTTQSDLETLANMAHIASVAQTPFLAEALSSLAGCPAFEGHTEPRDWHIDPTALQAWHQVRAMPESQYLGLIGPRFIMRLPYGKSGRVCEQFSFEEMLPDSSHESFLWGNPAVLCGMVLGQSFMEDGWKLRPGDRLDVIGLPVPIYEAEGERVPKPCAEVLLPIRAAEQMSALGLMPLLSVQNGDAVRIAYFHSIAGPGAPLSGRWN